MDKGFAVLEIDPEFKTLIRPLRKDEYLQLEVNLAVDGCREPTSHGITSLLMVITVTRYAIDFTFPMLYERCHLRTESKRLSGSAAISSAAEISRRKPDDISLESSMNLRKVARKHPPNINGFNQYKRRNKGERGDTFRRTAQKFSAQYNVSTGSVQKYAIFSKA